MIVAVWSGFRSGRRHRDTLDLIKTYGDQGRDPLPETLGGLALLGAPALFRLG